MESFDVTDRARGLAVGPPPAASMEPTDEREDLCVDGFLTTLIDARALKTAFELRVIDRLAAHEAMAVADLATGFPGDGRGLRLLLDLLRTNRVVEERPRGVALSEDFRRALRFRDLLETKLEYAALVLPDFTDLFTAAIRDPETFRRQARTFRLFSYDRALGASAEDYEATRRWMRITTCLTKYEAGVCLQHHDFGGHERVLDVGGNSGEFALRICRRYPAVTATVFDLPVVCDIGRAHVEREPEGARIDFVRGNALTDPLPGGRDLVSFKSMLHDWPERDARRLLVRASEALKPGGTLLIFERGPVATGAPSYAMIPLLLFFRSFRSPAAYVDQLGALGFRGVDVRWIDLETPFFLVTGTKP